MTSLNPEQLLQKNSFPGTVLSHEQCIAEGAALADKVVVVTGQLPRAPQPAHDSHLAYCRRWQRIWTLLLSPGGLPRVRPLALATAAD